jgi:ribonuclease Z
LDEIISIHLKYSGTALKFPLIFNPTQQSGKDQLLDLSGLSVYSFPLKHRIPCTGFSFEEKNKRVKLKKEMVLKFKTRDRGHPHPTPGSGCEKYERGNYL